MKKVLFLLVIFIFNNIFVFSYTNQDIYKRNGQLYILIGDGINKGIFGPFMEMADTVVVESKDDPDSKYLFSPGEAGKAIAADLFGNVYVLCSDRTPLGLPRLTPSDLNRLQSQGYPNMQDIQDRNFFRVVMGANGKWLYCDKDFNWNNHFGHGYLKFSSRWPPSESDWYKVYKYGNGFWKDSKGNLIVPNNYGIDTNPNSQLPNGYTTHMHTESHKGRGQFALIKDYKERYINFWTDYYYDSGEGKPYDRIISEAGSWDPYSETWTAFEKVFELYQNQYKYQAKGASCGDSPAGENYNEQPIATPTGKMGICVTCTGNRYFFTTLPDEMIKIGRMETGEVDASGYIVYARPKPMDSSTNIISLPDGTTSIGAATHTRISDYIYFSSSPAMTVADQWDGKGGIKYELANDLRTIIKTEMNGYNPGPSITITDPSQIPGTIEAMTADGNGTVYYGIKIFEEIDWNNPDTIENIESFTYNPGDDPNPPENYGLITHKWDSIFYQGWWFEVFRIKENDITDNKKIFQIMLAGKIYRRVDFGYYDASGNLVTVVSASPYVDLDASGGIDPKDIDVDLAVINIAGPPTSGDDFAHIDLVQPPNVTDPNNNTHDYISEDTEYFYYIENPPYFMGDILNKNENYGASTLSDRPYPYNNGDGFIGGFPISLVETSGLSNVQNPVNPGNPGLVYYFRIIDTLTRDPVGGGPRVLGEWWMPNATLNNGLGGTFILIKPIDPNKVSIEIINNEDAPGFNSGSGIGLKGFKILFKDPGVYKIQAMAVYLKYNYDNMPFPSWIDEREERGYYYAISRNALSANPPINWEHNDCYIGNITNFSNTSLLTAWGNPSSNVMPDYRFVCERTIHVEHKESQDSGYITHIKIHGPDGENVSTVNEDEEVNIYATFYVQWAKYFKYYKGSQNNSIMLDSYNGVGVWNYPDDGILPNNARVGAIDTNDKSNCITGNAGDLVQGGIDINGDGRVTVEDYPYNGFNIPFSNINSQGKGKWGTLTVDKGPGTGMMAPNAIDNSNLQDKDWKEIKYHWYVGAYIWQGDINNGGYKWVQTKIKSGDLSDWCVEYRKNVDSVDDPTPGENYPSDNDPERRMFKVKLNLKFEDNDGDGMRDFLRFVMPLSPAKPYPNSLTGKAAGCYYIWLEVEYPTLKWEPRDEKLDKAGNPTGIFSYYDLVCGDMGKDTYRMINSTISESGSNGYKIFVRDKTPPSFYYVEGYQNGGTTGDMFPRDIRFIVRDNNPNNMLKPDFFGIKVQIDNPSASNGNASFDNQPDRVNGRYEDYPELNLDTSANPSEGGMPGNGGLINNFKKLFPDPDIPNSGGDFSKYYIHSGGLENNIHRIINVYRPKNTVGPLAENYDNQLYWYPYGHDDAGNKINVDNIPPENAGDDPLKPWNYASKILVHDNDPPELSFTIIMPKLGYSINYQVLNDDRKDIWDDPKYGYVDEGLSGTEIVPSTTPLETTLVDNTEWDDLNSCLFVLDNNNGTERGKVFISVNGDGIKQPRLYNNDNNPLSVYDYFIKQGVFGLSSLDKPNPSKVYCENEYFDFGEFIRDFSSDIPYVLAIDEDMRVAFEVRARDNVDYISTDNFTSHILTDKQSGIFPVTFANSVNILVNNTPNVDWNNLPDENIKLISDPGGHYHAIFFYQFKESTKQSPLQPDMNVEWIYVKIKDNAGNIRAFKFPFVVTNVKLLDELLKREKMRLKWE